ncbi:MAG: hypothetical protein DMG96_36635 [Acidobacteria bacterium]|nr:MAG: hypothetical protein DMG98_23120 [Acidobacteriota bacterium]PYV68371.1 MAG: hypothetical protein DMG96_36635 [Acidobacteriota bacterium]
MRKTTFWGAACSLIFVALSSAGNQESWTFRGQIADSQCALNVHSLTRSHQEMLKSKSMGGNSAACALYCVKYLGGNFVLTTKKHVYHLDNQELAQKFVGLKVKVSGALDSKTDTIHVTKIESEE